MVDNQKHRYLYKKRGVFYFTKHVPTDLQVHYRRNRIVICLRTTNPRSAYHASRKLIGRLEDYWDGLRLQRIGVPGSNLLVTAPRDGDAAGPSLTHALETYLRLKGIDKGEIFRRTAERNVEYVIETLGNRFIGAYTSSDASLFRDHLFEKGMASSTVKRVFSSLRSIVNLTIQEEGLEARNAFSRTFIPKKDDRQERKPIPISDIRSIQSTCRGMDDDLRRLIALVSDTGMRLSEATGLLKTDLILSAEHPYIELKSHPWRSLKTSDSERRVPLVGASLWAARQLANETDDCGYLFPRYNVNGRTNSNSASAALNKWLRPLVPEGCVVHSFRHSLRDRLRAVECPADIVNRIGGWRTAGIGETYGSGYPIEVLHKWLSRIAL